MKHEIQKNNGQSKVLKLLQMEYLKNHKAKWTLKMTNLMKEMMMKIIKHTLLLQFLSEQRVMENQMSQRSYNEK